jgi:hypothetical protein
MEDPQLYINFDKSLYRLETEKVEVPFDINPDRIISGSSVASLVQSVGGFQSGKLTFSNDETGYILGLEEGIPKLYIGTTTNYLNFDGTNVIVSGTLSAGAIDIGGSDTTSFHVDINGNMWLGASTFASAPGKISNTGVATLAGAIIDGTSTLAGITGTQISYVATLTADAVPAGLAYSTGGISTGSDGSQSAYVVLTWTAISTNTFDHYLIRYKKASLTYYTYIPATTNTITIEGLTPNVSYNFGVCSVNKYGTSSAFSTNITQTTASDTTAPATVTAGSATGGIQYIIVEWTHNSDSDLASYNIYRSETNDSGTAVLIGNCRTNYFIDGGRTGGTTYYYWIKAVDTSGNVSASFSTVKSAAPRNVGNTDVESTAAIAASKILIDGAVYLSNWRHSSDITKIDGGDIYAASVTTTQLNFTPVQTGNVIASINASAEGITIDADNITISGSTTFASGYDPTVKVDEVGGTYDSAASGARVRIFPDANTGIQVIDDAAADVFKCIVGGTNVGDVIIGNYAGGQGIFYDKSGNSTTFAGTLSAATGTLGDITGGHITLTSGGNVYFEIDETGVKYLRTYTSCASWIQLETSGAITLAGTGTYVFSTYIHLTSGKDEKTGSFIRNIASCLNPIVYISGGANENKDTLLELNQDGTGSALRIRSQSTPANPVEGDIYAGTDHKLYFRNDSAWMQLDVANTPGGLAVFGDGLDGTVDINSGSFSSGPITSNVLTRDAYFNNLTLSGGNLDCGGYRLFVKGTLTVGSSYKVHRNGNNGGNAAVNIAGTGGASLSAGTLAGAVSGKDGGDGISGGDGFPGGNGNNIANSVGVNGQTGGIGGGEPGSQHTGGVGGSNGVRTLSTTKPRTLPWIIIMKEEADFSTTLKSSAGTGGSGGGAGHDFAPTTYGGGGGGSGSPGGIVWVAAKTIVLSGNIEANGGNGGDAANGSGPSSAGGGAAGCAGSGGVVVVIYSSKTGSGLIRTVAGTGGQRGYGVNGGYTGDGPIPALDGTVIEMQN